MTWPAEQHLSPLSRASLVADKLDKNDLGAVGEMECRDNEVVRHDLKIGK